MFPLVYLPLRNFFQALACAGVQKITNKRYVSTDYNVSTTILVYSTMYHHLSVNYNTNVLDFVSPHQRTENDKYKVLEV